MTMILNHSMHILTEILPVFLFAIVISSILDQLLPEDYLERYLSNFSFLSLFNISLVGALIPMCTCGMIPLVVKLVRRNIDWRLLVAFLVAGNACSIPALWLTTMLGYKLMFIRLLASVAYGILVAYLLAAIAPRDFHLRLLIDAPCADSDCCPSHKRFSWRALLDDVLLMCRSFLPWIVLAALVAAGFETYMTLGTVVFAQAASPWLAAIIGFPFYFCAGTDLPISRELLNAGVALGTVISFMLASPGLNLTSFLVYRRCFGLNISAVFLLASYLVAVAIGYVLG